VGERPTARDAVLDGFQRLERETGREAFRLEEVVRCVVGYTRDWEVSTIRTQVSAHMCIDSPGHLHADLDRVARGWYRRRTGSGRPDSRAVPPRVEPQARLRLLPTETFAVQLSADWSVAGPVRLVGGKLEMPAVPREPGIYRFSLNLLGPERTYVGETAELRRRMQQYRTPGHRQQTNLRLRDAMAEHLAAGGEVLVAVIVAASLTTDGSKRPLDLSTKHGRRLVENAALVLGDAESLNR